ncbi:hypothetical protein J1N35_008894 [Gossypium stocksii]|uniref:Uncharacterized protein n=1 Tax=Gossypium stocksii TaxID=47602 RepID=A0A9D4AH48_9ROSI|nr:hypothetical protein J1N35_008894 [Gossypium stocksii]
MVVPNESSLLSFHCQEREPHALSPSLRTTTHKPTLVPLGPTLGLERGKPDLNHCRTDLMSRTRISKINISIHHIKSDSIAPCMNPTNL